MQINGKKRADLTIARDADQTSIEQAVLALDAVRSALDGKTPKKIIVCRKGSSMSSSDRKFAAPFKRIAARPV